MTLAPAGTETFSTAEALACAPGFRLAGLNTAVQRGSVVLRERVGKGRAAAYPPEDVAQIAAFHELTRLGFPPRDARLLWLGVVHPRLCVLASQEPGTPLSPKTALIARDPATEQLAFRLVPDGEEAAGLDEMGATNFVVVIRIDRFLGALALRMEAVKAGTAMPDEPGPLRGADPDPMGAFGTDADGQRHLVGLTVAESRELMALNAPGNTGEPGGPGQTDEELDAEDARRESLQARHDHARILRAHAEAQTAKGES